MDTSDKHKRAATESGASAYKDAASVRKKLIQKLPTILLFAALIGFSAWTVILYSYRLLRLQERVQSLEEQCQLTEHLVQQYLDKHLDKLVEQVS